MNFSSWVILLAAAMISASIAFSNHYGILALTEWVLRVIRLCPLPRECLTIGSHAEVICQGSSSNKGQHKLLAVKAMDQRLINCVLFTVSSRVNHCKPGKCHMLKPLCCFQRGKIKHIRAQGQTVGRN